MKPPLYGEWRSSEGLICCGTLRIAALDIDTNPSDEFKEQLAGWMCHELNKAQDRTPSPREAMFEELVSAIKECLSTLTDGECSEPYPYLPAINQCRKLLTKARSL